MSERYPGGLITKSPVTPSGPYNTSTAPGVWTLEQQAYWQKQGQWPTQGNNIPNYIEDVFSTYLYTGNGSTQTITNGIDLAGKGGLVWIKSRSAATGHRLTDTVRGATKSLASNSTNAQVTESTGLTAFGANGFDIGADADYNTSAATYVSWSLREQPKFFDIVTWSGNDVVGRQISHSLGSAPGCMIIKASNQNGSWWIVYHRSLGAANYLQLQSTDASAASSNTFNDTAPTDSVFTVGASVHTNASGYTYVAYLFAHDAGGFGLTGEDNVISCGSYSGNGSSTERQVDLDYEPQWLLIKSSTLGTAWYVVDNMRGFSANRSGNLELRANSSAAEGTDFTPDGCPITLNANGFNVAAGSSYFNSSGNTYIYIAIRRGPMKVPTSGTSVFSPVARAGTGATASITSAGFAPDLVAIKSRDAAYSNAWTDRLRGNGLILFTDSAVADQNYGSASVNLTSNMGVSLSSETLVNQSGTNYINYLFQRAPSFFDVVCYSGNDTAGTTQAHNLGVAPEFMIVKRRNQADGWFCYHSALGATKYIPLNDYQPATTTSSIWDNTAPTASVFTLGWNSAVNGSGSTYVAYLFSTLAGVSKVGSYTGTGTTLQVNCGFTSGARFVLIKRTNGSGDSADGWYVWDSARGIVSGNDPYLLLNSTAAEVTGTDYVDTYSAGFEISSTAPAAINANGGTFIFLAIS